jgi:hypothetical protein
MRRLVVFRSTLKVCKLRLLMPITY